MKAGTVGALIVLAGGMLLAVGLFAKDKSQLGHAQAAFEDGRRLLGAGKARDARREFERALEASLHVNGGITGKRARALELASDARKALRTCEAFEALQSGDARALATIDEALDDKGARSLPREGLEKAAAKRLAQLQLDAAQGLEKVALETDKRAAAAGAAGVTAEALATRGELHALASRAYELAKKAAEEGGFDWVEPAGKGARRCETRSLVAQALAENAADHGAAAKKLAESALEKLAAPDAFEDEKERPALKAATDAIFTESQDRDAVNALEEKVAALEARVPTNELGTLRPSVEAVVVPELKGGHKSEAELRKKHAAATALLTRVREAATDFEGMVLALDKGETKLYVDRTEVTNEEYKRFVDTRNPYEPAGRTPEVWGSPEAAKGADDFIDSTFKTGGPATWASGAFPAGLEKHPVAGVSLLEARAFARFRGKRLPTHAEWLAAAGFPSGSPSPYPWGTEWKESAANVRGSASKGTTPVGSFPEGAARTGALDLTGNVRELVEDEGGAKATGGSHSSKPELATLDRAVPVPASTRPKDQGFRCARELTWKH